LAHPAGHKLLDLSGWNAQPGGLLGVILGDQRAGDIIALARPFAVGARLKCHPGASLK
jgi:hypothetical protein